MDTEKPQLHQLCVLRLERAGNVYEKLCLEALQEKEEFMALEMPSVG